MACRGEVSNVKGTPSTNTPPHGEKLIDKEYQRDELVVEPNSRYAVIAVSTQHHRVYGTHHHDECYLDKHRDGKNLELSLQLAVRHECSPLLLTRPAHFILLPCQNFTTKVSIKIYPD